MKSHKAAQKRIGVTGSGKFIRVNAWSGHHLEIKSSRRTRRYAGKAVMVGVDAKQIRPLLPYTQERLEQMARLQRRLTGPHRPQRSPHLARRRSEEHDPRTRSPP